MTPWRAFLGRQPSPPQGKTWECDVQLLKGFCIVLCLTGSLEAQSTALHTHPLLVNSGGGVSDLVLLLYHIINCLNRGVYLLPLQKRSLNNSQWTFVPSLLAPDWPHVLGCLPLLCVNGHRQVTVALLTSPFYCKSVILQPWLLQSRMLWSELEKMRRGALGEIRPW